ncbi:MAG: hypothetical protein K7J46_02890 [Bryobacter sp.]|jgi:hypothetical protein|nr:hypothetical protein [Bryobacter sp. CoA8 C33]
MRRYLHFFVFLLVGLLSSCRTAQRKAAPFDPLSLGPPGATLKAFLDRQGQPRAGGRAMVSQVTIEASLAGMNRKGKMVAQKTVAPNGHISYEMKSYEGDNLVKTKVIGLYLSAEQEASETTPPAINGENYQFKFKRKDSLGDRIAMIFELTPVRKMIGLFKGELWLEEGTGWEMRQSGRLVKNPSVIFRSADLTRDFALHLGASYLSTVDYQAETRVIGRITLKMNFEPPQPMEAR